MSSLSVRAERCTSAPMPYYFERWREAMLDGWCDSIMWRAVLRSRLAGEHKRAYKKFSIMVLVGLAVRERCWLSAGVQRIQMASSSLLSPRTAHPTKSFWYEVLCHLIVALQGVGTCENRMHGEDNTHVQSTQHIAQPPKSSRLLSVRLVYRCHYEWFS